MNTKKIAIAWCCLAIFVLAAYIYGINWQRPLRDEFTGSFVAEEGINQIIFSISLIDNQFYYTDQANKKFILGYYEPLEDNLYYIECQNPDNANIIPNQTVRYEDLEFSVIINDNTVKFVKLHDYATTIGPNERYF